MPAASGSTPAAPDRSMAARAMGPAFDELHPALRRFHGLSGSHALTGWAEVTAPRAWPAALLARLLGTPTRSASGPIRFELHAGPTQETWVRHFPGRTMRSRLRLHGDCVVESLGPVQAVFALRHAGEGRLSMELRALRVLGMPCPRWLAPRIVARETGHACAPGDAGDTAAHLAFHVEAALPLVGRVTCYRGHLRLPAPGHQEGAA